MAVCAVVRVIHVRRIRYRRVFEVLIWSPQLHASLHCPNLNVFQNYIYAERSQFQ